MGRIEALGAATSGVAHVVHYGVLAVGVAGVIALLVPIRRRSADDLTSPGGGGWAEHHARLDRLRADLASGPGVGAAAAETPGPHALLVTPRGIHRSPRLRLAVAASLVAAAVHAAVCPEHLAEGLLLGVFFAACALAQVLWSGLALRRPDRAVLAAGVVLNLALVALWITTRTLGLPLGLLPGPEEVGGWDLTAVVTELLVVAGCVATMRELAAHRSGAVRAGGDR